MDPANPDVLIERVRALPAAGPLLERLPATPRVHLVGGAVRDLLQGGTPFDLDLVVEGDATALAAQLGPARVYDRFGTSTVTIDGREYDLARARRERYEHPGALPEVQPAPLEEDLERRDFTVNTIAIALNGEPLGELHAVPQALDDLRSRQLRVLHERSFIDDPTRLFRLARYAGRLGFAIEPTTHSLGLGAVRGGALGTISGSRIGAELRLLARERDPVAALAYLRELELDAALHPQFGIDDPELGYRALELLPEDGRRPVAALALACSAVPEAELRTLLDGYAFEAGDRDAIIEAGTGAAGLAERLAAARAPSEMATAVGGAQVEAVALAGALGPADQAREWLERHRHVRLEIDGRDLIAAGIPEGPAVGAGLRATLAAKLDGLVKGRGDELEYALQAALASG